MKIALRKEWYLQMLKKLLYSLLILCIWFSILQPINAESIEGPMNGNNNPAFYQNEYCSLLKDYQEQYKINAESKETKELKALIDYYPKYILQKKNLSINELREQNYTNEQIDAIKNYDGSYEMTKAAAATVSGTLSHNTADYDSTTNRTTVRVSARVQWNGTPLVKGTDSLGIALVGSSASFVRSSSSCLIVHPGSAVYSSAYQTTPGLGIQYRFGISLDSVNVFNSATIVYYGVAQGNVSVYAYSAAYSHYTIGITTSFGLNIGGDYSAGISFSPKSNFQLLWWDDESVY